MRPTPRFVKALRSLGQEEQKRAAKSMKQFLENPRHPSLHFEKLRGSGLHTIRVDMNFRIALDDKGGGVYDLIDVGSREAIYARWG